MSHTKTILRLLILLLSPALTFAADTPLGLGAGVGAIHKPYTDSDAETLVLPVLMYENRWISVSGPALDFKLNPSRTFSLRLRARYEPGAGYEADDADILVGMDERKAGVWLGASALWSTRLADFGAEWLADGSGYSGGQRATLSAQKRFPLTRRFSLTPRLEAIYLDEQYVDYYFGVAPTEMLAGRPAYAGDSTLNGRLSVRLDFRAARRHSLFLDLAATQLGSEIEDSPIVGRATASSIMLGYMYLFATGDKLVE